jgi:hypothetical protein
LENPQYNTASSRTDDKDLDCGGRAQRRHRFPYGRLHPKAAWRFASRRSPKSVVAAQAASGFICVQSVAEDKFPLRPGGFALKFRCACD